MQGIMYKGIMNHTSATMCYRVPPLTTKQTRVHKDTQISVPHVEYEENPNQHCCVWYYSAIARPLVIGTMYEIGYAVSLL
jgi:hypothetical protein